MDSRPLILSIESWTPEQGWGSAIQEQLGMDLWRIPVVIFSAIGIYLTFLLLVKVFGARILSPMGGFDAILLIMVGAVAGRVIIGHPPSLAAGVLGLTTLMALVAVFGAMRHVRGASGMLNARPIILVAHGQLVHKALEHTHTDLEDVRAAARQAGAGSLSDIAAMVLESNGAVSVIKEGQDLDPFIFLDADGSHLVLKED